MIFFNKQNKRKSNNQNFWSNDLGTIHKHTHEHRQQEEFFRNHQYHQSLQMSTMHIIVSKQKHVKKNLDLNEIRVCVFRERF